MSFRALVMIPTFNEAASIGGLIDEILLVDPALEILVIDDNSPDRTGEIVLGKKNPRVHLLKRSEKQGLGSAYRAGITWALDSIREHPFTHLVTMDGDGSHRPEDLAAMLARSHNVDLTMSSRWMEEGKIENWPKYRQYLSKLGTGYAQKALKLPYSDLTGGFRIYATHLIKEMKIGAITSEGYCFQIEMVLAAHACGATISEVPITFVERATGVSKMSRAIVMEALIKVSFWGLRARLGGNADKLHYVK